MNLQQTTAMITRFARDLRRAWLFSIRLTSEDFGRAKDAADRFADTAMSQEIEAAYGEMRYVSNGLFNPLLSSNRLSVGRLSLATRFLQDVQESAVWGMIGLNARQRSELTAYGRTLRSSLSDDINSGKAPKLSESDIQRQVRALNHTMLSDRSAIIAEDVARASLNRGVDMALEQLAGKGIIVPRKWNTLADGRVRDSHASMDGQVRPTGEPFITGNGYPIMYPHDGLAPTSETANCRCFLTTEKISG